MSVDARNVLSPHTEEMNMMLAENIDSILGSSSAKLEKGMGRLSLVSFTSILQFEPYVNDVTIVLSHRAYPIVIFD